MACKDALTVIITGANNGIGLHMTEALLQGGFRVAGFDLYGDSLHQREKSFPDRFIFCQTDVTEDSSVAASVQAVINKWGQVDILVNNACLAIFSAFEDKALADTRREFEVNYFGYVRLISAVLPHMKARGKGSIYNVSSGVGITGFPGIYGYASTKGAIEALTLTLAIELKKHGISVATMHPPLTNTKSASPLGIPARVMADPAKVGRELAAKILFKKPIITANLQTSLYLSLSRIFPVKTGKLMAKMTENVKAK